jgi:L-ascorbate metabolism protein UlaG (beta-lactamase superfamily)
LAAGDRGHLHLWWLGQSGFLVQWQGHHVLIDPYLSDALTAKYAGTDKPHVRMSDRVVDPKRVDFVELVTSSHAHTDHLDGETLRAIRGLKLLAPRASLAVANERSGGKVAYAVEVGDVIETAGCRITAVTASHGSTPAVGYVFEFGDHTIYHSGDTTTVADNLRDIDIAILPINGKLDNMNGREAANSAKEMSAKLVIPCHYDLFEFNTADPAEEFIPQCERLGQPYRVLKLGERFTYPEK